MARRCAHIHGGNEGAYRKAGENRRCGAGYGAFPTFFSTAGRCSDEIKARRLERLFVHEEARRQGCEEEDEPPPLPYL